MHQGLAAPVIVDLSCPGVCLSIRSAEVDTHRLLQSNLVTGSKQGIGTISGKAVSNVHVLKWHDLPY